MLISSPINPETQRRQALGKVYALLISLAENKEQPQSVDDKEQASKLPKDMSLEKDNQKVSK